MEPKKSIFATLSEINCNDKTEKKQGLTYLSWAWAWGIVKSKYPTANYEVCLWDGKPYLFDANLGYLIKTIVTIEDESIPMHLFVMDGANKAQKHVDYKYMTKSGEKSVIAATMFDINTTIMRCLTKNLAMFGLGHYIYAGEDLPEESEETKAEKHNAAMKAKEAILEKACKDLNECTTMEQYAGVWKKYDTLQSDAVFFELAKSTGKRVKEIKQ
jgi:hypothetical protein